MTTLSPSDILNMLDGVSSDADAEGIIARYASIMAKPDGTRSLLERLDESREALTRWKSVLAAIEHLRRRHTAAMRHELEEVTQEVLQADGLEALAKVASEREIVFTGTFLNSLSALYQHAIETQEVYTAKLLGNRLKHLQLLRAAQIQGLEVTRKTLLDVVYAILEAETFADLLERIRDNPVVLAESFDDILRDLVKASTSDPKLFKVAKLRVAVLQGMRGVVEAVVLEKAAQGTPEEAVDAFGEARDAEQFLHVIARFPFVLGADFGGLLARELAFAQEEKDENAVAGIQRRRNHLKTIGEAVTRLTTGQ